MIVSVISLVVFPSASLVAIYIVFTPSHVANVRGLVDEHVVQFVGLALVPYAIWIPLTHASVGHVIFNVTHVKLVHVASLLILNPNHVGAVTSYRYV